LAQRSRSTVAGIRDDERLGRSVDQRGGAFSPEQEQELERPRRVWAEVWIEPAVRQAAAGRSE
jgi:hypothetical protein